MRLWEYKANYVELAGSLMISHSPSNTFLYTPSQGLQVLKDYQDLKDTLLSKFSAAAHEDELYGLLSLDERNRFIGFNHPQVSGEVISGSIFKKSCLRRSLPSSCKTWNTFCRFSATAMAP